MDLQTITMPPGDDEPQKTPESIDELAMRNETHALDLPGEIMSLEAPDLPYNTDSARAHMMGYRQALRAAAGLAMKHEAAARQGFAEEVWRRAADDFHCFGDPEGLYELLNELAPGWDETATQGAEPEPDPALRDLAKGIALGVAMRDSAPGYNLANPRQRPKAPAEWPGDGPMRRDGYCEGGK